MTDSDHEGRRKRDITAEFLQKNLAKGELALKHAVGLGHIPNAVPVTQPVVDGTPRPVEVGWHPVGGLAGKWFAEQTGLGKMITEKTRNYPDPTQHWAVLVGNYAHQLWMDESFHVIYTNERVKREDWRAFPVGETRFNDDAIRRTGESVIQSIRDRQPAYNLISNNCQTYALELLDAIKSSGRKEFGTTLAVYERLFGHGKVLDLFPDTGSPQVGQVAAGAAEGQDSVSFAQNVMNSNTTQLDAEHTNNQSMDDREMPSDNREMPGENKKEKKSSWYGKLKKKIK